jgi:hypothetical protein
MLFEEVWTSHGRMTAPAQKGDVCLEPNISGPVRCRVWLYRMAEKTNWLPVHDEHAATFVQHDVRIDLRICFLGMTLKAERPAVGIRTFPKEIHAPSSVVFNVAGQTHDFPIIERERVLTRTKRKNAGGMMIFPVFMALEAFRRQIGAC